MDERTDIDHLLQNEVTRRRRDVKSSSHNRAPWESVAATYSGQQKRKSILSVNKTGPSKKPSCTQRSAPFTRGAPVAGTEITPEDIEQPSSSDLHLDTETSPIDHLQEDNFSLEGELDTSLYRAKLVEDKCVHLIGNSQRALAFRDISSTSQRLKNNYVIVERRAITFISDNCEWIHFCSCNEDNSKLLKTMNATLETTHSAFIKDNTAKCIHIAIAEDIYNQLDHDSGYSAFDSLNTTNSERDHSYSEPTEKIYPIHALPKPLMACIHDLKSNTYGVVAVQDGLLKCVTCCKPKCQHVTFMEKHKNNINDPRMPDLMRDMLVAQNDRNCHTEPSYYVPKALSKKLIPYHRCDKLAKDLETDLMKYVDNEGNVNLIPKSQPCPKCNELLNSDPVLHRQAWVFHWTRMQLANVFFRKCLKCDHVEHFDGQDDAVLNMGTYLVGYEVLRHYLHSFLNGKRPMYTFYQTWVDVNKDYQHTAFEVLMSYDKFKYAWYAYIDLLDLEDEISFQCPTCGTHPDVIVCDGTALSFRRQLLITIPQLQEEEQVLKGSERVLLQSNEARKLLRRYACHTLQEDEFEKLMFLLGESCPALADFVRENDIMYSAPQILRDFYHSLASESPISTVIPPTTEAYEMIDCLVRDVNISTHPVKWKWLQDHMPLLFHVVSHECGLPVDDSFKVLLKVLHEKASQPFVHALEHHGPDPTDDPSPLGQFPNLPPCRGRGFFAKDKSRHRGKRCNKEYRGHPTLLPGIFTIFCRHAPKVIIYDFACALQRYCLNRDPLFFKSTLFLVDRFHWSNHKACSKGHELSLYAQLKEVNSQISEQVNAGLNRIKDSLSYMTEEHFLTHCLLFLYQKNQDAISQLKP